MLTLLAGLFTLTMGYEIFTKENVGIFTFQKSKRMKFSPRYAKITGMLFSIWGVIFSLIGFYIIVFDQSVFNFAFGIWFYGYIVINLIVVLCGLWVRKMKTSR
jgi:AAA+ ATPase superfamily predicted ATPase